VGGEKVACWSTKATTSLKRADRGKVTMEGLYELTNALSNGTVSDPLRPPLPQDWGFATPTQNFNIISGTGKELRTSNLARTFMGSIGTKAH